VKAAYLGFLVSSLSLMSASLSCGGQSETPPGTSGAPAGGKGGAAGSGGAPSTGGTGGSGCATPPPGHVDCFSCQGFARPQCVDNVWTCVPPSDCPDAGMDAATDSGSAGSGGSG
jgi:hypothetical protein